jgi:hypothetical protein
MNTYGMLDKYGNGICPTQMREFLKKNCKFHIVDDLDAIMRRIDRKKTNIIQIQEFQQWLEIEKD